MKYLIYFLILPPTALAISSEKKSGWLEILEPL
jgi:hypothetical protein